MGEQSYTLRIFLRSLGNIARILWYVDHRYVDYNHVWAGELPEMPQDSRACMLLRVFADEQEIRHLVHGVGRLEGVLAVDLVSTFENKTASSVMIRVNAPKQMRPPSAEHHDGGGCSILVIDDEYSLFQEDLDEELNLHGIIPEYFEYGEDAIHRLETVEESIVLLDHFLFRKPLESGMPRSPMAGVEVANVIDSLPGRHVVIVCSVRSEGHTRQEEDWRHLYEGFHTVKDFARKNPRDMCLVISKWLSKSVGSKPSTSAS